MFGGYFPVSRGHNIAGAEMMAQMMGVPVVAVYLLVLMEVGGALLILWGGFGP